MKDCLLSWDLAKLIWLCLKMNIKLYPSIVLIFKWMTQLILECARIFLAVPMWLAQRAPSISDLFPQDLSSFNFFSCAPHDSPGNWRARGSGSQVFENHEAMAGFLLRHQNMGSWLVRKGQHSHILWSCNGCRLWDKRSQVIFQDKAWLCFQVFLFISRRIIASLWRGTKFCTGAGNPSSLWNVWHIL